MPLAIGAVVVAAAAPVAAAGEVAGAASTRSSDGVGVVASSATGMPRIPPAPQAVCGNQAELTGPASAPTGAVVVSTQTNLADAVERYPGGKTTFWVSPGVHTLGPGQFDQVIPADGDTFVGAPGAVIDGQHRNLYAFTQGASDVTIEYLTIENFGQGGETAGQGVVNHNSGSGWVIAHDTIRDNAGAGVMLGSDNILTDNCLTRNGEYGFNAYAPDGVRKVTVTGNEISHNDTYNWEVVQSGCGCAGGGKFWETTDATVTHNYVVDTRDVGLWVDTDNSGFDISSNYIADNYSEGIIYEISYNARIADNVLVRDALGAGPTDPGFPVGAIYISESGGDGRAPGPFAGTLQIDHNLLVDNWSGVVLWESADRFCGSPDNTSSGTCTLVDPAQVTTTTCSQAHLEGSSPGQRPVDYYDDCRWRTRNVAVTANTFAFSPSAIGRACTPAHSCGLQGLFSQFGTSPPWSPYKGDAVEDAITRSQGNHFVANTYIDPWRFMVHDQAEVVGFSAWQGSWRQDAGSRWLGVPGHRRDVSVARRGHSLSR